MSTKSTDAKITFGKLAIIMLPHFFGLLCIHFAKPPLFTCLSCLLQYQTLAFCISFMFDYSLAYGSLNFFVVCYVYLYGMVALLAG
jgi:hypothetical protein